ncbi:MAG: hypothetical protein OXI59_06000 [Gemmatimonadota bacterium]|nr:hypothetical protein [Gemmatimonadota bacterium]
MNSNKKARKNENIENKSDICLTCNTISTKIDPSAIEIGSTATTKSGD